jgi:hypothetical protein
VSCLTHATGWANAPRWGKGRSSPTTPMRPFVFPFFPPSYMPSCPLFLPSLLPPFPFLLSPFLLSVVCVNYLRTDRISFFGCFFVSSWGFLGR